MIRPRRSPLPYLGAGLAASLALSSALPSAHAQRRSRYSSQDTASVEVARRQALAANAESTIITGDQAMDREDYELAMRSYKIAVDALPPTDAIGSRRSVALAKFFDATMKRAEQLIVEGHYGDAEITAKIILQPEYDPTYQPAIKLLAHLDDPEYYNQTQGPKFLDKVQQVKQLFSEAQGYYDSARYELAFKRYEQILALDPTNAAARKGEERISSRGRAPYREAAYDEQRARAIDEVNAEWARPVRRFGLAADPRKNYSKTPDAGGTAAITRKLSAIIIPNIEFRQTTIRDAIEYLRQESRRLDISEPDPDKRGVNIFLKLSGSGGGARPAAAAPTGADVGLPGTDAGGAIPAVSTASADQKISLTLSRIPLLEALRYVAQQAGLKVKVEPYAVSIVPLNELTEQLINAEFRVAPSFIGTTSTSGGASALNQGPTTAGSGGGTTDVTGTGAAIISRQDAKTFLEQSGVVFPPGASATYIAATSKLVVRNTQDNIDIIERLVEQNVEVIRQVEIESKFVEINQTNVKELSFDVGLGAFNIPGSTKLFGLGGTAGASSTGSATTGSGTTSFSNPNGQSVGGFPVTSGNRSGSFAISANAIDALLFGTGASAAPGIFSLAGVFTDPQFQIIMRALNQSKGVDLLSAPRVTTKSGQKATIEIIREFLYPTQFQPPQIPQNFGNQQQISLVPGVGGGGGQSFPVTPTTPTNFEKRNTGVTLEVDPVIGPDNFTIDLTLQPQVVDFEGFINYGSPIQTISSNPLGVQRPIVLTPNTINQPVFSTRRVSTSVTVYDGSTVVLGGLVREDIQKVNDKVPILGDIPLAGRLFRSKVDQNIKRNLIIFVTARLIDPSGQPLLNTEEDEETVPSLIGPETVVTQTVSGYSKDK